MDLYEGLDLFIDLGLEKHPAGGQDQDLII
jgi:hypothetical protein